ncbi:MAG: CYTH and CHAD domain-containing protein [Minwuiales bacterium]|nr:CYTH and CHAD domain-containing protein [Minwuiales bacterium]
MATNQTEIELKLTAESVDALSAVLEAPCAASGEQRQSKKLETVYFDTPDLRLKRRGVAYRVRNTGDGYVQTVKVEASPAGGLKQRAEWEAAVDGPEPDLDSIDEPTVRERLGMILPGELKPIFATRIDRETRIVNGTANGHRRRIEMAFDKGTIETETKTLPIAEVELELLEGRPEDVYQLALELLETVPLRIELESKSARGYALAGGGSTQPRKARRVNLRENISVEEAMAEIVRGCLEHWSANEASALDGGDPEGIHQMRVALRRLRSALIVFSSVIPEEQLAWFKQECKWLLSSLGPARDWDVFNTELLAPVIAARPDDKSLARLGKAAATARENGNKMAEAAIKSPRYAVLMLRLGAWLDCRRWRTEADDAMRAKLRRPMVDVADALLSHRHKKALKLGRRFRSLPTAQRHVLRIALKKLRYSAEFFSSLYGQKRVKPYVRGLSGMQDALGHLNDVAVAERLLEALIAEQPAGKKRDGLVNAAGVVVGWYSHGVTAFEPETVARWREFKDHKAFWHT